MPTTVPEIAVAAGVIVRGAEVFLTRRLARAHQGGKWEFPGGKLEAGESPEAALARELAEEIGIQISGPEPLIEVAHDYGDKAVRLHVFVVSHFEGEPTGLEGQEGRWFAPEQLADLDFPAANAPIVEAYLALVG